MTTEQIPDRPVPLSGAEAERMGQRQLKKHHLAIILLHWFNAMVWLAELVTGVALIASPALRVAPAGLIRFIRGLFGTQGDLLAAHVAIGLVWIGVFLAYGVFGWRTYLHREVLEREIALDREDLLWLRVRALGILGRSKAPLPPQGIYNAGQKLFALMVYAMIPVIMLSGLAVAFRTFGPGVVGWAAVIHFASVGAVVTGLIVHVYMGAVFPEEKPAFFSMVTGTVNEHFAYTHHFKWWRAMRLAALEREQARDRAAAGDPASGEPSGPAHEESASTP